MRSGINPAIAVGCGLLLGFSAAMGRADIQPETLVSGLARKARPDATRWRALFNGKDLTGWDTWLGVPDKTLSGLDLPRDAQGEYTDAVGLNKDPKKVFTVVRVDGAPAIRISGEIYGALTSREEFENYHLRFEYKWGEKKWPPKLTKARDSGVLYHAVGAHGVASRKAWMRALECQVQEHDTGDYWSVVDMLVDVTGRRSAGPAGDPVVYQEGGEPFSVGRTPSQMRAVHSEERDRLTGWNVIDLLVVGGTAVHVVNGKMVMLVTNARTHEGDKEIPVHKGKLQIQSEGAEIFYRNIAIRPLTSLPREYRP